MEAFVTGSQVYGKPTADSDVDLVVRVTQQDLDLLRKFASANLLLDDSYYGRPDSVSLRFGKLNLICAITNEALETWKLGTETLKAKKPVDRSFAVELFRTLREAQEEEALEPFRTTQELRN